VKILLIASHIGVVSSELLVEHGELRFDVVGFFGHGLHDVVVRQLCQVGNDSLTVGDEIGHYLGVQLVVADQLLVVRFNGELIILSNSSLTDDVLGLSEELFAILISILVVAIVEVVRVGEPDLVDDVLVRYSRATERRNEEVGVVPLGEVVLRQVHGEAFLHFALK